MFHHSTRTFVVGLCTLVAASPAAPALAAPAWGAPPSAPHSAPRALQAQTLAVGDTAAARYWQNTAADEARHATAFQKALDQLP
ncbi:hypothetical protein [Streptomyces sp. NPDC056255]|uniref:hypothetical protein n=1 Tax=Streptomyces sp. NPDC056255 TaxID=3345764 RepID=UPI0035DBD82A